MKISQQQLSQTMIAHQRINQQQLSQAMIAHQRINQQQLSQAMTAHQRINQQQLNQAMAAHQQINQKRLNQIAGKPAKQVRMARLLINKESTKQPFPRGKAVFTRVIAHVLSKIS
jgi:hypothetical protein